MRRRILIRCIVLVAVGITVAALFTAALTQNIYVNEARQKLQAAAALIKYQIQAENPRKAGTDLDKVAAGYAAVLNSSLFPSLPKNSVSGIRVAFISFKGDILGRSPQYGNQDNANKQVFSEISQAAKGMVGEDIRYDSALHMNVLHVAVPAKTSGTVIRVSMPLVVLNRINKTIWECSAVGFTAGILITVLLAFRFSASVSKPITELIEVSEQISAGNYGRRVGIRSNDEFGWLSESFNRMAARLESTVAEMKDKTLKMETVINSMTSGILAVDPKYRIILINSITCEMFGIASGPGVIGINLLELIRNSNINDYLKTAMESGTSFVNEMTAALPHEKTYRVYTSPLKAADGTSGNAGAIAVIHDITNVKKLEQMRTEFVSNVTHELKTPLTSIRGFIETLRGGAMNDPETASKFLDIIDIEAERLYMLINDILQLSEIENRQKDSNIGVYSLKPIIAETFSILQETAAKKGVILSEDVEPTVNVTANRDRIKQMLINLVDNGIKYNVENGRVAVEAAHEEGKTVITVRDTGIGIPPEHLSRIFERFYRVDKGRSRSMGGTGLGLSIVKHIVNLYGGDIKVSSKPEEGTEFVIQLPV